MVAGRSKKVRDAVAGRGSMKSGVAAKLPGRRGMVQGHGKIRRWESQGSAKKIGGGGTNLGDGTKEPKRPTIKTRKLSSTRKTRKTTKRRAGHRKRRSTEKGKARATCKRGG